MQDLRYKGNPFSWVGKRQKEVIESCLDRVFTNSDWQASYPESESEFLPIAGSDHAPVVIHIADECCVKRGQFRYDKRHYRSEDFIESVTRGWEKGNRDIHGDVHNRLRLCRKELARWKRRTRRNSADQIEILKHRLDAAQRDFSTPNATIAQLRVSLNQTYREEELFWKLKSRNQWLKLGERNTKFFHAVSKVRKSKNRFKSIIDDQGIEHFRDDAIGKVAEKYFSDLFSTTQHSDMEEIISGIEPKVTAAMNRSLLLPVTNKEIKDAVFSIGPDRAPGVDGFTAAFYHQFWDLIGEDVCSMVRSFFETGEMNNDINQTQLCLIPKTSDSKHMADYRPISLCTVNYKIISKVLIMRLKQCLGSIISESQAAFVPGRNISDNILVAHEIMHSLKAKKGCQSAYMAVKTDISKAYDRVEWNFLEKVMLQLGFDTQWVKKIMACISTVTYEVLINGSPYGKIYPTRGLRQGDPLSPYLFLFCADVLSCLLRKAERDRRIHGIKITNNCPSISHLLFADDSLFFCRTTTQNCEELAAIFKRYEEASGQKINYSKSSVIFGTKVPDQKRQRLQRILRITKIGGGGKYLGLPEQFGRKKVELFEYIITKIKERTEGWTHKYLSPAGKEILIKSIAMALPVYSMNCFLLPVTICDEIIKVISSFWWGQDHGKRKISWVAWKRMSIPKREGGLGFKDLQNFNKALLAKQAWPILTNPTSLIARLYKGLYFPCIDFLQAKNGSQASYGWKSIQEGKALLHKGIRHRIGNGQSIRIWEDPWLPTLPPRPAHGPVLDPNMRVADLWKENEREWEPNIFEGVLNPEDQSLAKELFLSKHAARDTYEWAYTQDACYTVRSGYWVATHVDVEEEDLIRPPDGSTAMKKEIWNLKIGPKIQHFLWRCLSGALSTATQLCKRSISADPVCQRCCLEDESINHILFMCPYAKAIWRCVTSELGRQFTFTNDLEENIRSLLQLQQDQNLQPNKQVWPFWSMWRIWKSRNDFLFQKKNRHPSTEARKGIDEANEWMEAQDLQTHNERPFTSATSSQQRRSQSRKWEPPPLGWLKCNFDSGFVQGRDFTPTGWIIRDSQGKLITSGNAKLRHAQTAIQAEALGFLHALQMTWAHGFRCIRFEGDNLELVNLINRNADHQKLGTLLYDIHHWMRKLPRASLGHVNRERNAAADMLSRQATKTKFLYQCFNVPPRWLVNYLYKPFTI